MASEIVSWLCVLSAVLFFGSNFAVCAKYDAGDGMFFQLCLCTGIWMTGMVVYLFLGLTDEEGELPKFYPFVMIGGAIWCTGNCFCVFVVKSIGLGPGLVTWGSAGNAIGWLTGFFGLFGLPADQFEKPYLNVAGFVASIVALVFSTMIKKTAPGADPDKDSPTDSKKSLKSGEGAKTRSKSAVKLDGATDPLITESKAPKTTTESSSEAMDVSVTAAEEGKKDMTKGRDDGKGKKDGKDKGDKDSDEKAKAGKAKTPGKASSAKDVMVSSMPKDADDEAAAAGKMKLMGICAALFAGSCFGVCLTPYTWVVKNVKGASPRGLDYVFNQYSGIFMTSVIYFLIYCAVRRNRPEINPRVVLPGFVSGVMWAIAQTSWFVANEALGFSICFPIILVGPGFIGCLWSVFFFKDIHGQRNFMFIGAFFTFVLISVALILMAGKK